MSEQQPHPHSRRPHATPDEEEFRIGEYVAILFNHKWAIFAVVALALTAAATYTLRQPRIYRATARIIVDINAPQILNNVAEVVEMGAPNYWSYLEFYNTQHSIVTSRAVLSRVVDDQGLAQDADFLGLTAIEDPALRRERMAGADPVALLQGLITVSRLKDSRIFKIAVEDRDPERAARLANSVASAYMAYNIDQRLETTRMAVAWLGEQLRDLQKKIDQSEQDVHEFKKQSDMLSTSMSDRENVLSQKLQHLNARLSDVRAQRLSVESFYREAQRAMGVPDGVNAGEPGDDAQALDIEALSMLEEARQSQVIQTLKEQRFALRRQHAELSQRYGEKHPRIMELNQQIASIEAAVAGELKMILAGIEMQYRALTSNEHKLEEEIERVKKDVFDMNVKQVAFSRLSREDDNNKRLHDMVLKRFKEADLTSMMTNNNNVSLLELASAPTGPVKPRMSINMLAGLVLGLTLGVAMAFLLEHLDNTVTSPADVEKIVGERILGIIPRIESTRGEALDQSRRDLYAAEHPRSQVAECCRTIRTNILFMSPDNPPRRILVTSAGPREGKTTCSVSLAVTLAQSGSRTVLVDTDMRKPRVHTVFGFANDVGVTNLVLQGSRVEDIVHSTPYENLSVIACGPLPPNPAELIGSEAFRKRLDELGTRFDRVVLDSPPTELVADSLVLSQLADGVVLVARGGVTIKHMLAHTMRALRGVNAHMLGAVLNNMSTQRGPYRRRYYYSYGYGYGYGHGYGSYGESELAAQSAGPGGAGKA